MDNKPMNTEDMRVSSLQSLERAIKRVARVRRGLIVLFGMEAEEVDAEINKMCEKHYETFNNMNKADLLIEALMDAVNESKRLEDAFSGGVK